MDLLVNLIPLFFFLGIVIAIVSVARRLSNSNDGLRQIAARLGLEFEGAKEMLERMARDPQNFAENNNEIGRALGSSPEDLQKLKQVLNNRFVSKLLVAVMPWTMKGRYRGLDVNIQKIVSNTRGHPGPIRFQVQFTRELPFSLEITSEKLGAKFGKALGGFRDIEVGQSEFDDKLCIKGTPEHEVKGWLMSPSRRDALLRLFKELENSEVTEKGVVADLPQGKLELERCRQTLDTVTATVDALRS